MKLNPESSETKALRSQLVERLVPLDKAILEMERQRSTLGNIIKSIGKQKPTIGEFRNYKYSTAAEANVLMVMVNGLKADSNFINEFENKYKRYRVLKDYMYNLNYDPRASNKEYQMKFYGNNDVKGPDAIHGTHISGVIAANRENEIGIKGIARDAKIMSITAIPDGDALDKDVASAIRYAADNGARIINISSGKNSSTDKFSVDEAVRYAMSKDILIVHAAGNKGQLLDEATATFPSRFYLHGGKAENWIEVGASNAIDDESLLAWFSNYGSKVVDVFAPGVDIYSTIPGDKYVNENGTSMAAPVVSGLAALIWSYYPKLNASQVKFIIMSSVAKVNHSVRDDRGNSLSFSSVCLSGGVVNAYNAIQLASRINDERQ
ncbi:S8 family serine peptidase [Pedobacter sp. NJ-S-72]